MKTRKTEDRTAPPAGYVYYWDRIFGALAVLLLLIGGIGYGTYRWITPSADPVTTQPAGQLAAVEPSDAQPGEQEQDPAPEAPLPIPSGTRERLSAVVEDPGGAAFAKSAPAVEPPVEPADDQPPERQVKEPESRSARTPSPAAQRAPFRLQEVSVVSPAVERFLLAKSVINNEPRGDLEAIVPKADGAAAVYCFSDVVGMKDEVLYYHWLRDGKRVAKVRVGAWGKRWRSHSSKILNPTMKGDWRVELRKADNTLLASAEFVYR